MRFFLANAWYLLSRGISYRLGLWHRRPETQLRRTPSFFRSGLEGTNTAPQFVPGTCADIQFDFARAPVLSSRVSIQVSPPNAPTAS